MGEQVYKNEFSNLTKGGRRVMTEEENCYKLEWQPLQTDKKSIMNNIFKHQLIYECR